MNNIMKGVLMVSGWLSFIFMVWISGYWTKTILVPILFTPITAIVLIIASDIAKRS